MLVTVALEKCQVAVAYRTGVLRSVPTPSSSVLELELDLTVGQITEVCRLRALP